MTITIAKLAAVMVGLALSIPAASASAQPALPDIPDVDEAFAAEYADTHAREICSTIEYRLAQMSPHDERHPVELVIEDVRAQGGFPNSPPGSPSAGV